jgi:hypothetical protein
MAKRREEGHCFNCPAKFSREHLKECTMRGIYPLEVVGETTVDDEDIASDDGIQISLNALTGISSSMTMHLDVNIAGARPCALVDSGSTHCFIATTTARRLGLSPLPRSGMSVGVANGKRVACAGIFTDTPVRIGNELSNMDVYIIPLEGHEAVLGCQWLRTLGPIIWDFEYLSMSFWR